MNLIQNSIKFYPVNQNNPRAYNPPYATRLPELLRLMRIVQAA